MPQPAGIEHGMEQNRFPMMRPLMKYAAFMIVLVKQMDRRMQRLAKPFQLVQLPDTMFMGNDEPPCLG